MKVEATVYRAPSVREKVCFDAGVKGRPSHRPRFCYHTSHGVSRALESRNRLSAYAKTVGSGTLNIRSSAEPVPLADIWSLSRARVAMHGPAHVQVIEDRMIHADRA